MTTVTKMAVALQICQALFFLHAASPPLAHLDVKPSNILVWILVLHTDQNFIGNEIYLIQVTTKDFHAYLADFGLAKISTSSATQGTRTVLAGSPGFQAPEQLKAESTGTASDVYAYGGVLSVLFGEQPVWPGLSAFQIMCKVTVAGEKPPTSHLPCGIQRLCSLCFNDLSARPSIASVLQTLLSIQ